MEQKKNKVFIKGNHAIGYAAVYSAGVDAYFGYPITPQNELTEYMAYHMIKNNRVFIQGESELASINMVMGAAMTGARAMTSSSSPGISLKQEAISYMAGMELPALIVNIVRGGPGLGNISGAQSDYYQSTRGGGHGDYRTIVLAPYSVQELADFTVLGFRLADKYRTPVILQGDGYLGQMMEGIVLPEEDEERVDKSSWVVDGAQGRPGRRIVSLLMGEGVLEKHNYHLERKYKQIEQDEVRYEQYMCDDADAIIVAYGFAARICEEAVYLLRDAGYKVGLLRPITLWPFPYDVLKQYTEKAGVVGVIEMSMGQMIDDVRIAVHDQEKVVFYGRPGGGIPGISEIVEMVKSKL